MNGSPTTHTARIPDAAQTTMRVPDRVVTPTAEWLAALGSRTPSRQCADCGDSIGAARLTLHPDTSLCAWCAPRATVTAAPAGDRLSH